MTENQNSGLILFISGLLIGGFMIGVLMMISLNKEDKPLPYGVYHSTNDFKDVTIHLNMNDPDQLKLVTSAEYLFYRLTKTPYCSMYDPTLG